jgi:hypothetical protein
MNVVKIMEKKFQRKIENFICEHCGAEIIGNGYTDHCPVCLWGKHVDINPGDRAAECGGAMEPLGIEERGGEYRIQYQCQKCHHKFTVKAAENDEANQIINLSSTLH